MWADFEAARRSISSAVVRVVEPLPRPEAPPGKCWQNVRQLVRLHGGTAVQGWALGDAGPVAPSNQLAAPLYSRWVNHILWCDLAGRLWEVTPYRNPLSGNVTWEPTHFVIDDNAGFETATEAICCPQPAVYVAVRPEGQAVADFLCRAERAPLDEQEQWVQQALESIKRFGFTPISWRLTRVGDKLRDILIVARLMDDV